ncbi:MAG: ATPase [Chloroflexi bacterium HGW-Chloroflexi-10]|nr:MAG: ATPase [Chloroflexi bacterium HGW-Chloroflexi-10]
MTNYYLGADLGATKTHVLIADEHGIVKGFGQSGPGNHEAVGYEGFKANLHQAVKTALSLASLTPAQITGSGFGIAGYDWPVERESMLEVIDTLNLGGAVELVNDCELGLLVGSPRGWGITVVSGTGCNCRGWDETRTHFGRVTGGGLDCGEFAGASELMFMVSRAIAYEWTGRGSATALSKAFVEKYNAKDLTDLLQSLITQTVEFNPSDVRLFFQVAASGDPVALDLIRWAGHELGELANSVIRQLQFESVEFDLVQIGSMFAGNPLLSEEMKKTVYPVAPKANFIRAQEPPVVGAVLLGMQAAGQAINPLMRANLIKTITSFHKNGE